MTAPTQDEWDDARFGGQGLYGTPVTAPAAGEGDTRDGRPCCGHPNALTDPLHAIPSPARPAAAPADDTGELREAIREVLSRYDVRGVHPRDVADAVLALPAVRALIDGARTDRARITAVEALVNEWAATPTAFPGLIADEAMARINRVLGGGR